jgi:hypothetical protein
MRKQLKSGDGERPSRSTASPQRLYTIEILDLAGRMQMGVGALIAKNRPSAAD